MINFRYHVVSLTAVFLALAIGLVVGTAALNGPVADSLKDRVTALSKDNQLLRDQVVSLQREVDLEEEFVAQSAAIMLNNKLTERRIALVVLPSGQDYVEGVTKMLALAGASVTARVDVLDKFVDPDNGTELLELATRALPPSIPAADLPRNSDGVETSAALLANVLVERPQGTPPVAEADIKSVLSAYRSAGYLNADEQIGTPAQSVLLISGQPYVDREFAKKDAAVVTLAVQFDRVGPIVVAGNGASGGNVVAVVRGDPTLAKTISTVDHVNTVQGQVVTVLAATEQVVLGRAGQYGVNSGATALVPSLQ